MGGRKPTLGYRSRTDAVVALRAQGLSTGAIADLVGIPYERVSALEHSAGRRRSPRPAEVQNRTVLFPTDVLDQLGPHAARRTISANELARRIVEAVIDDDLVDAVLDDGLVRS